MVTQQKDKLFPKNHCKKLWKKTVEKGYKQDCLIRQLKAINILHYYDHNPERQQI